MVTHCLQSYERFWKALDQYDPIKDIQIFIQEKGTGPKIPEPEIFVDYMDDPAKTFQKHTIANFPIPPEFEEQKPELTVRNPTATPFDQDNSALIQRKGSLHHNNAPKEVIAEPSTPSRTTERKKSIIRNVIKPLPSISTPVFRQKSKSRATPGSETKRQPAPVMVVPEISSSSTTTDTSDCEDNSPIRKANKDEEGDITIDPRAKVVFAIGNNMFDLGHLDLDDTSSTNDKRAGKKGSIVGTGGSTATRRITTRRRQPSADLDAACNFSYQSLLEELGVFEGDKSGNSNLKKKMEEMTLNDNNAHETSNHPETRLSTRRSQRKSRSYPPLSQQQQQQQQHAVALNDGTSHHINSNISPAATIASNQDMYNTSSLNNDPYIQTRQQHQHHIHLQQQQQQQQQQQYYQPYAGTSVAPPLNIVNQPYHQTTSVNEAYQPPSNTAQSNQSTLFWGKVSLILIIPSNF
jgi:hypothetical protein